MIRIEKLDKSYVTLRSCPHVLESAGLAIEAGEMVSVMGASGSGRSTLMNVIGLLDSHDSGSYQLDGQRMKDLSETRAAVQQTADALIRAIHSANADIVLDRRDKVLAVRESLLRSEKTRCSSRSSKA